MLQIRIQHWGDDLLILAILAIFRYWGGGDDSQNIGVMYPPIPRDLQPWGGGGGRVVAIQGEGFMVV